MKQASNSYSGLAGTGVVTNINDFKYQAMFEEKSNALYRTPSYQYYSMSDLK